MALVLPIVAGMAFLGQYLVAEGKEPRRIRNIRKKIDKSDTPTDENIYDSDLWRNSQLEERRLANQYWRNAYEIGPADSNIVPEFYNQIYDKSSRKNVVPELYPGQWPSGVKLEDYIKEQTKPYLVSNNMTQDGTILSNAIKVADESIQKNKDAIYAGPMFEEYTNTFPDAQPTQANEEISVLTGLPMEKSHNNMVPFYGGKLTQNMKMNVNEQKLETFTGVGDIIQRNKKETDPFFELHRENIYGTPNMPDELRNERYYQSNLKTSLLPVPQIRVRSVKPEFIRPRFRNVDELRTRTDPKITYDGRVQGPAGGTPQRGIQARVYKRGPPKYHFTGMERFGPGASAVNKHQVYENFENLKCTARENSEEEYYGVAYASEAKGPRPYLRNHGLTEKELREKQSDGSCGANGNNLYQEYVPRLGNDGCNSGVCPPTLEADFEVPKKVNFTVDNFRNLSYTDKFVNDFSKCGYLIPVEERESTQFSTQDRNLTSVTDKRFTKRPFDKPRATHRQTRQSRRNGNLSSNERYTGAYKSTNFYSRPTHKETTLLRDYLGTAQKPSGTSDPMRRDNYWNAYIRGLKSATDTGYVPGRERSNLTVGAESINMRITNQLSNQERVRPLKQTKAWVRAPTKDSIYLSKGVNRPSPDGKNLADPYIMNQLNSNVFANPPIIPRPPCEGEYGKTSVVVKTM